MQSCFDGNMSVKLIAIFDKIMHTTGQETEHEIGNNAKMQIFKRVFFRRLYTKLFMAYTNQLQNEGGNSEFEQMFLAAFHMVFNLTLREFSESPLMLGNQVQINSNMVLEICCFLLNTNQDLLRSMLPLQKWHIRELPEKAKILASCIMDAIKSHLRTGSGNIFELSNYIDLLGDGKIALKCQALCGYSSFAMFLFPFRQTSLHDKKPNAILIPTGNPAIPLHIRLGYLHFPNDSAADVDMLIRHGFTFQGYKDKVQCMSCKCKTDDWTFDLSPTSPQVHESGCHKIIDGQPAHLKSHRESYRIASFLPFCNATFNVLPIAHAGFYLINQNLLQCFCCKVVVANWMQGNTNLQNWHSPNCNFLLGLPNNNEPIASTLTEEQSAHLASLKCSICHQEASTHVSIPCAHIATCDTCVEGVSDAKRCPLCERVAIRFFKIR